MPLVHKQNKTSWGEQAGGVRMRSKWYDGIKNSEDFAILTLTLTGCSCLGNKPMIIVLMTSISL